MSILAGAAAGNLIAQWVPVKDGMCSSRLFLILIRIKFTDLTDSQTEACHSARNGSLASFSEPLAFFFLPQNIIPDWDFSLILNISSLVSLACQRARCFLFESKLTH